MAESSSVAPGDDISQNWDDDLPLPPKAPRIPLSELLLDWMEEEGLDYNEASDIFEISPAIVVAILNGAPIRPDTHNKLAYYVHGMNYIPEET